MNSEEIGSMIAAIQENLQQINQQVSVLEKKVEDRSEIDAIVQRLKVLEESVRRVKGEQTSQKVLTALRRSGMGMQ